MFLVTRSGLALTYRGADWSEVGRVSGEQILHGQWWRVVTALTLHADVMHLVGNVIACLIFWVGWHYLQMRMENRGLESEALMLRQGDNLLKAVQAEHTPERM